MSGLRRNRLVSVPDMTDAHLQNTKAMMERNAKARGGYLTDVIPLGVSTGETFGGEVFEGPEDVPLRNHRRYNAVCTEIKRRALLKSALPDTPFTEVK